MDIQLLQNYRIVDAERKLLRFMQAEYEVYDGASILTDSIMTINDILLAVVSKSRANSAAKVRNILPCKQQIEQALSKIPCNVSLTDKQVPWEELEALLAVFKQIHGVGIVDATRILHKKRPLLIPICDDAIRAFTSRYRDDDAMLPQNSGKTSIVTRNIRLFRDMLLRCQRQIHQLGSLPEMANYPVSPVRLLGVLLWIESDHKGRYMSCPKCHSEAIVPIEYGFPTERQYKKAAEGKCYLGGCIGFDLWYCPRCDQTWGMYQCT